MRRETGVPAVHPAGEQPVVELAIAGPVTAETFASRVHLEWEPAAPVTMMGQLAFFIEYLKQGVSSTVGWVGLPSTRMFLLGVAANEYRAQRIQALLPGTDIEPQHLVILADGASISSSHSSLLRYAEPGPSGHRSGRPSPFIVGFRQSRCYMIPCVCCDGAERCWSSQPRMSRVTA
jgi:hypothetical protein